MTSYKDQQEKRIRPQLLLALYNHPLFDAVITSSTGYVTYNIGIFTLRE